MSALAAEAGWSAVAARRLKGAEQRYLASDTQIFLVDVRRMRDAVGTVAALSPAVEASGGILVALGPKASDIPAILEGGATLHIGVPIKLDEFRAVLGTALRLVERLGGGLLPMMERDAVQGGESLGWRLHRATGQIIPSSALSDRLEIPATPQPVRQWLRYLQRSERSAAVSAIRAIVEGRPTAGFAHDLGEQGKRVAHHLHASEDGIAATIEILPEPSVRRGDTHRDHLTGVANRKAALDWVAAELGVGGAKRPILLLLSVSRFDRLNAAYGEVVGDALLRGMARRIENLVEDMFGARAIVARITGADYVVGLAQNEGTPAGDTTSGIERAKFLARRLVAALARPFSTGDDLVRMTARCGIAQARKGDDAVRLLRRAGTALADARDTAGAGIRVSASDRQSRELDTDRLDADLRLALARNEISVLFQPQYASADNRMVGVEALARWQHPELGALGAGILFGSAERSDYLLPLSAHIQHEALRLAAKWPQALKELRLSVNVTASDLGQPEFLETFLEMIDSSGFPRSRLTVEITESGLIDDLGLAAGLLQKLRQAGLAVAVDDFGTGYSSLAYLKSLPLDYLKIDSGLAQDIAGSERDGIIVRGVIGMAKSLGLRVIAEGVETEQQLALLREEGCDFYQGFLRSAATSSEHLADLMTGSSR